MYIDEIFLDSLQEKAKKSERLRMNCDLRDSSEDLSQRMLNAMEPETEVPIHRHQDTSETVIILRGSIDEIYYDNDGNETQRFHLDSRKGKYGLQIPRNQWHTLKVYEPSVIIEMKNGPFVPRREGDILEK